MSYLLILQQLKSLNSYQDPNQNLTESVVSIIKKTIVLNNQNLWVSHSYYNKILTILSNLIKSKEISNDSIFVAIFDSLNLSTANVKTLKLIQIILENPQNKSFNNQFVKSFSQVLSTFNI